MLPLSAITVLESITSQFYDSYIELRELIGDKNVDYIFTFPSTIEYFDSLAPDYFIDLNLFGIINNKYSVYNYSLKYLHTSEGTSFGSTELDREVIAQAKHGDYLHLIFEKASEPSIILIWIIKDLSDKTKRELIDEWMVEYQLVQKRRVLNGYVQLDTNSLSSEFTYINAYFIRGSQKRSYTPKEIINNPKTLRVRVAKGDLLVLSIAEEGWLLIEGITSLGSRYLGLRTTQGRSPIQIGITYYCKLNGQITGEVIPTVTYVNITTGIQINPVLVTLTNTPRQRISIQETLRLNLALTTTTDEVTRGGSTEVEPQLRIEPTTNITPRLLGLMPTTLESNLTYHPESIISYSINEIPLNRYIPISLSLQINPHVIIPSYVVYPYGYSLAQLNDQKIIRSLNLVANTTKWRVTRNTSSSLSILGEQNVSSESYVLDLQEIDLNLGLIPTESINSIPLELDSEITSPEECSTVYSDSLTYTTIQISSISRESTINISCNPQVNSYINSLVRRNVTRQIQTINLNITETHSTPSNTIETLSQSIATSNLATETSNTFSLSLETLTESLAITNVSTVEHNTTLHEV